MIIVGHIGICAGEPTYIRYHKFFNDMEVTLLAFDDQARNTAIAFEDLGANLRSFANQVKIRPFFYVEKTMKEIMQEYWEWLFRIFPEKYSRIFGQKSLYESRYPKSFRDNDYG